VADVGQLPDAGLNEVAFAGRSNVGKSSLINALTGRNTLARTSNTPGRTQELNYFELGGAGPDRLILVDLPGYGYARAPKQQVKRWTDLVMAFLKGRQPLRRVCLLIDSRHGIKPVDEEVMTLMDKAAASYQVTLTKADKPRATDLAKTVADTEARLSRRPAAHPIVHCVSSRAGTGLAALRADLAALCD